MSEHLQRGNLVAMHLDMTTLAFTYSLSLVIAAGQLGIAWRQDPSNVMISRATLSFLAQCLGLPLLASRDIAPDFISFTLANAMVMVAHILVIEATRGNNQKRHFPVGYWALAVLTYSLVFNLFVYIWPNFAIRSALNFSILFVGYLWCSRELLRHFRHRLLSERVTGILMAFYGVTMLLFAINDASMPADYKNIAASTRNDILALQSVSFTLILAWSFINIANGKLKHRLEKLAHFDGLTGCLNRRAFMDQSNRLIRRNGPDNATVMMLDLDKFKHINDRFGHDAGDQVLKQLAEHLQSSLRPGDLVGRLGGEEFAILLLPDSTQDAEAVAARLISSIPNTIQYPEFPKDYRVTASIGVIRLTAGMDKMDTALHLADKALYAAKNAGRNRFEFATGAMS